MPEADSITAGTTVPDELFAGRLPIRDALGQLRLRLLDLTARNRLLNFKHSPGKSLQFVHGSPDKVFARLLGNQGASVAVNPVPEPEREFWVRTTGRLMRPDVKEHAHRCGIKTALELAPEPHWDGSAVRALYYPDELARHCRKLAREARSAIEETGANMLFLVHGFLEFPDRADAERMLVAPLICVPVALDKARIDRETGQECFSLKYTGEDLEANLSLREKLAQEYSFVLPEFNDEAGPEAYFRELERLLLRKPNWKVRRHLTLALLSFSKMLLVRELDPELWALAKDGSSALIDHPIVRMVFEGAPPEKGRTSVVAAEYVIDGHQLQHLPLIYDADSSQHSALIDALSDKNLVIEGPPGTGKSQTITNLVAAALAAGKTVLFVSEKLAALEVVKKRLAHAGLAPFCLELHSNKTQKKHVLEELQKRRDATFGAPLWLDAKLRTLEEKRQHLAAYADLLNGVHGNACGLTVHQVLWRAERFRQECGDRWEVAQQVHWPNAPSIDEAGFRSLSDTLARVADHYREIGTFGPQHPYWGLFVEELLPGTDLRIERTLRAFLPQFQAMDEARAEVAALLGAGALPITADTTVTRVRVLIDVTPADSSEVALDLLPRLFPGTDLEGFEARDILHGLREKLDHVAALHRLVGDRLLPAAAITLADGTAAETLQDTLLDLGLESRTTQELQSLHHDLATALGAAMAAMRQLEVTGDAVGHPFHGDVTALSKITTLIEVAETAPRDLLPYRHSGLRQPTALEILKTAHSEFLRLRQETTVLETLFYLDTAEESRQLTAAITTLREGPAWYRVFQGQWRRACATHRALDRSKAKKSPGTRLEELERVNRLLRGRRQWVETVEYREVLGPFYGPGRPRFDEAMRLAQWQLDATKRLVEGDLDPHQAGIVDGDEQHLVRLANLRPALDASVQVLQQLNDLLGARFGAAQSLRQVWANAKSWQLRLEVAQTAEQQLAAALGRLSAWAPLELPVHEVLRAVQARAALPAAMAKLNADEPARKLLQDRFLSADTNLDSAFAALNYGRRVLQARLPVAIIRALLSDAVVENHQTLTRLFGTLLRGWDAIDEFAGQLGQQGRFDLDAWAGARPNEDHFVTRLIVRTTTALAARDRLLPWVQYVQAAARARERNLEEFVDLVEREELRAPQLVAAFGYRFFGSIAHAVFLAHPQLARFAGVSHEKAREEFATLDREVIQLRGRECAHRAASKSNPPNGKRSVTVGEKTEMELVNHMVAHPRARVTLRRMLKQSGAAVQALKPCFMMGPQAVAQYLEPGAVSFDIVVMDEASQLKPEEAIGAIARGKQLIVVGDPKQLPPTTFFDRLGTTADESEDGAQAAAVDSESILDVCMGHFRPVRTLRWHYRSRHESLIAFSNSRFYENRLIVFPSPYGKSKRLGLRYHYVSGAVYESQTNQQEAARVVGAAVDHMLNHPEDSLGIVTLNLRQRDLIEELLDQRCRNLPQTEEYRSHWESEGMGLFVKNLESVQGDERDVIFISTTFGRAPNTNVVRQNFGPISRQTGWRRLNVLFTRARQAVHVYTSMRPEDIVIDEGTPRGTRALRHYLEFARTGILTDVAPTGVEAESDFEVAVTEVLRAAGHEVVPQLGVAGYRLDLAVKHPDYPSAYLAAIECDGASYHSGVSVRDRDRIRQEILESLGWQGRIWRIWSTDWFRSPSHETKRLLAFLQELVKKPMAEAYVADPEESDAPEPVTEPIVPAPVAPAAPAAPPAFTLTQPVATPARTQTPLTQQSLELANTAALDESEDGDLEVEVGDVVTYAPRATLDHVLTVRIAARQNDFQRGIISEATPLAQTLLGATVGDEVVLRVPGQPAQTFVVQKIVRQNRE